MKTLITKCKTCNYVFSSRSNYLRHVKSSRKCLKTSNEDLNITLVCKYCDKNFTQTANLKRHLTICHQKQIEDIEDYYRKIDEQQKKEIKDLKLKLEKLTDKMCDVVKKNNSMKEELDKQKGIVEGMKIAPDKRTIYNTAIHPKLVNLPINNIRALTNEFIEERVSDGILTYEKATKGYRGMLDAICDLITHENDEGEIERNYVCTDVSRNSFHRLLASKEWKSDKGGRYLNNMLKTFRDVMEEYKDKAYDIYKNTPHDSMEWSQVDWERKNISKLYSGVVCKEGTEDRNDLVNALRKEIAKRASV